MAKTRGWICLHRKVMERTDYFAEPFTRPMAWIDLLLLANHADNSFRARGIRVVVKRGQVGQSLENLATRWKWSRGRAERFMRDLENDDQIIRQKNNVTTLITIVNWGKYQDGDNADSDPNDKPNSKADGKQTTMNNNGNNDKQPLKKRKKEKELFEVEEVEVYPANFDENYQSIWKKYKKYRQANKMGWYKSAETEFNAMQKFLTDSQGDASLAEKMFIATEASMWKGLFPIKQQTNGTSKNGAAGHQLTGKTSGTLFGIDQVKEF